MALDQAHRNGSYSLGHIVMRLDGFHSLVANGLHLFEVLYEGGVIELSDLHIGGKLARKIADVNGLFDALKIIVEVLPVFAEGGTEVVFLDFFIGKRGIVKNAGIEIEGEACREVGALASVLENAVQSLRLVEQSILQNALGEGERGGIAVLRNPEIVFEGEGCAGEFLLPCAVISKVCGEGFRELVIVALIANHFGVFDRLG